MGKIDWQEGEPPKDGGLYLIHYTFPPDYGRVTVVAWIGLSPKKWLEVGTDRAGQELRDDATITHHVPFNMPKKDEAGG